jgi:tetratricopeptide (TPR) repeat protein
MMSKKYFHLLFLLFACTPLSAQTYEEYIKKSYEYSDADNLAAAGESLINAMRLEPANKLNYALLTNLGTIRRRQGKFDDALISYTAALSQRPKDELILTNRAELYTEMNEIEKAINDYNSILINYPASENALYNRGLLYINTGEYILAEADFETITDTYKDTFFGRIGFGILEKARGKFDESEIIFNYLIDNYPNNIRVLEERAELYFLTKRNARAMTDINKAFSLIKEPSAELYMLRGRIKLVKYEKESAAIDFKKAAGLGYDKETVDRLLKETF